MSAEIGVLASGGRFWRELSVLSEFRGKVVYNLVRPGVAGETFLRKAGWDVRMGFGPPHLEGNFLLKLLGASL